MGHHQIPEGGRGMNVIKIATDFSRTPSGRFPSDGPDSGEAFREKLLRGMLQQGPVDVVLDGASGYPSSFLEEAFGGLVRKGYFSVAQLRERLHVIANDTEYSRYIPAIWRYIDNAAAL